jgi:protein-tyrosine kinase
MPNSTSTLTVNDPDIDISFDLSPALVTLDQAVNGEAESYRALRTHIMARHVEGGRRALAVCAPTMGVGCTRVVANLAVALSQIGLKTLLIDANLRDPGLDQIFRPSRPVVGLQQCLSSDDTDYSPYTHTDVLPDLSIMFSGGTPANAQELLATDRFAQIMNFCLRDYAVTLLDTPAANRYSDAIRISTVVGYSLIVARRDKTLVNDVRTLVGQLENDRARVVGTVMIED